MSESSYRSATLSWGNESLDFSNRAQDPGAEHYLTKLKGWFDGVGVKGEDSPRLEHGSFLSRKYRSPRNITLEATLIYKDEATRDLADRFVSGVLWDGQPGTLRVQSGGFDLEATVVLDGTIAHEYKGKDAVEVQIPLQASDPFLYSPVQSQNMVTLGTGEGLEYPLFSKGTPSTPQVPVFGVPAGMPTGEGLATQLFTGASSVTAEFLTVSPYSVYRVNSDIYTDKPNTDVVIEVRFYAGSTAYPATYVARPRPSPVGWATYSTDVLAPGDADRALFKVYPNNTSGTARDAVYSIRTTFQEVKRHLTFGQADTSAHAILENRGTAESFPVFIVKGTFASGITISDGRGHTVELSKAIFPQAPVRIDMAGSVTENGNDFSHLLTRRDWFSIPPGSSIQPIITAPQEGSGWVEVQTRHTYI